MHSALVRHSNLIYIHKVRSTFILWTEMIIQGKLSDFFINPVFETEIFISTDADLIIKI
jgi:hypothetical protein